MSERNISCKRVPIDHCGKKLLVLVLEGHDLRCPVCNTILIPKVIDFLPLNISVNKENLN